LPPSKISSIVNLITTAGYINPFIIATAHFMDQSCTVLSVVTGLFKAFQVVISQAIQM